MIGESEPLEALDGRSKLEQARDAVLSAAEMAQETTVTVARAIDTARASPAVPLIASRNGRAQRRFILSR